MITNTQLTRHLQDTGHALFGPSSLARRELCPASAIEELKNPSNETSPWAEQGTLLHEAIAECALFEDGRNGDRAPDLSYLTDEQIGWVQDGLAFLRTKIPDEHYTLMVEQDVTLSLYGIPEVTGTADVIIANNDTLTVIDWKFGSGVPVEAEGNLQLAAYAIGAYAINRQPMTKIQMCICQPPLNSTSVWVVTHGDMLALATRIENVVADARGPHPKYNPSMQACRFCDARMVCQPRSAYLRDAKQLLAKAAADKALVKNRLVELLDAADAIQQAIKDVRFYAESIITKGGSFGNYKMVHGRGSRSPIDQRLYEEYVVGELGEDAYKPREVVSIAQAEKLKPALKKDIRFNELWQTIPGKPILVSGKDKRPAIQYGSKSAFQKLLDIGD